MDSGAGQMGENAQGGGRGSGSTRGRGAAGQGGAGQADNGAPILGGVNGNRGGSTRVLSIQAIEGAVPMGAMLGDGKDHHIVVAALFLGFMATMAAEEVEIQTLLKYSLPTWQTETTLLLRMLMQGLLQPTRSRE